MAASSGTRRDRSTTAYSGRVSRAPTSFWPAVERERARHRLPRDRRRARAPRIGARVAQERPRLGVDVELVDAVERASDARARLAARRAPGLRASGNHHPGVAGAGGVCLGGQHAQSVLASRLPPERDQCRGEGRKPSGRPRGAGEHCPTALAQRNGSLVLHASAACVDGSAVMLCAESGSGKSSLLMGLVAAGWEALSEDQCVDRPRRRRWSSSLARPELGAAEARRAATTACRRQAPRFEAVDKIAWDLGNWVAHSPATLEPDRSTRAARWERARLGASCRARGHRRAHQIRNLAPASGRLCGGGAARAGQARDERSRVPNADAAATRLARARRRSPRGAVARCAEHSSACFGQVDQLSSSEWPTRFAGIGALPSTTQAPACTSPSGPTPGDGPHVDVRDGRAIVVHGNIGRSLEELQRRGEPVSSAVESDGARLRAARDPMGLAPLFYRVIDQSIWLATEVSPLVALRRPSPDLAALSAQAALVPDDTRTGFDGHPEAPPGPLLARDTEPASDPTPLLGSAHVLRQLQGKPEGGRG